MSQANTETLIVGAGLAGSMLAWRLIQAGQRVHVIHNPKFTSASRVAAGMINPITGQRLVLQNNIEQLLPAALKLYTTLAEYFAQTFFFAKPMLHHIQSDKEQLAFEKRRTDERYKDYLGDLNADGQYFWQHHTGYLNTNQLLNCLHQYLLQLGCLQTSQISPAEINMTDDGIQFQAIHAKRIIFCEGWRGQHNPYFKYLPFQPAKGDILNGQSKTALPSHIINQGKWLLPTDAHHFRLGASFEVGENLDEKNSQFAADALMQALHHMPVDHDAITITGQQSGIRPNTLDKQPFLGFHPAHKNIAIFNGFGSKGSLLIPLHSEQMCSHIIHNTPLPKHVDIQRFSCV